MGIDPDEVSRMISVPIALGIGPVKPAKVRRMLKKAPGLMPRNLYINQVIGDDIDYYYYCKCGYTGEQEFLDQRLLVQYHDSSPML